MVLGLWWGPKDATKNESSSSPRGLVHAAGAWKRGRRRACAPGGRLFGGCVRLRAADDEKLFCEAGRSNCRKIPEHTEKLAEQEAYQPAPPKGRSWSIKTYHTPTSNLSCQSSANMGTGNTQEAHCSIKIYRVSKNAFPRFRGPITGYTLQGLRRSQFRQTLRNLLVWR